ARGHPVPRRLEGLALHPGGHLLPGGAVRLHPAGQHLLRPGLGAGAGPGLLRRPPDHPGRVLPRGEPLLVAESDPWDPAGAVGVLGVGLGPGVCPGPADLSDLVLGRVPGVVPGLLPDLFGLPRPPRRPRGRRRARRHEPRLTTGPSSPTPAPQLKPTATAQEEAPTPASPAGHRPPAGGGPDAPIPGRPPTP